MDLSTNDWHIISNPNSNSKNRKNNEEFLIDYFSKNNIRYTIHTSDGTGKGCEIARELCANGIRHLMIFGGDGSINEVVNGIYESGINTEDVCLAIVPLGTGNDFCRTLGYPKQTSEFLPFMEKAEFIPTDVGIVESVVNGEITSRRRFINIAGFAFDAAVINETVKGKPKLFPNAVYLMKLVKVLFSYKATRVNVTTAEGSYSEKIFTIACGNAQYNGNGMHQVPMADPHDGLLDLVTIRDLSPLKVVANVKNLFSGKHITMQEVKVTHTPYVELSSDKPLLGEVEGEMLTTGDYRIRIEDKKIKILQAWQ